MGAPHAIVPEGGNCTACSSSTNSHLTLHTFHLFLCKGGDPELSVGNVSAGNFQGTPELKDHFNGQTGELDARIVLRRTLEIIATCDALTRENFEFLLNEDAAYGGDSYHWRIPLTAGTTLVNYVARMVHIFPDGHSLEIKFHNASIASGFNISFSEDFANFQLTIAALKCPSPPLAGEDYGYLELYDNVNLPASG
jgi:hypothetical protein